MPYSAGPARRQHYAGWRTHRRAEAFTPDGRWSDRDVAVYFGCLAHQAITPHCSFHSWLKVCPISASGRKIRSHQAALWTGGGISSPSFPHPPSTLGTGGHTGAINACVVSVGSGLTSTITGDHSGHGQQSHPKEPPQQVKDWKQSQPAIFYFYLLIKGKLKHSMETDYFKHTAACHAKTGKSPHSPCSLVVPFFSVTDGSKHDAGRIFSLPHCFQAFSEVSFHAANKGAGWHHLNEN